MCGVRHASKAASRSRARWLIRPSNTGAFQNLAIQDVLAAPEGSEPIPQFYADAAVVAYRAPASDVPLESLHPKVTASAGTLDAAMLSDGDLEKTTKLPIPAAGESAWIQYEFAEPQTIRSVTIATKEPGLYCRDGGRESAARRKLSRRATMGKISGLS